MLLLDQGASTFWGTGKSSSQKIVPVGAAIVKNEEESVLKGGTTLDIPRPKLLIGAEKEIPASERGSERGGSDLNTAISERGSKRASKLGSKRDSERGSERGSKRGSERGSK